MKKAFSILIVSLFLSTALFAQLAKDVQIVELNNATFKEKVWNFEKNKSFTRIGNLPIILDFHATWCRPCKMLAPHLQLIQNNYRGKLVVYKVDVDKDPELAKMFQIRAMPTIIFIADKTSYTSELGYKDYNEFETIVKSKFFAK